MRKPNYIFSKYPLYSNETPVFRETKNQRYVSNGKFNDYPDYLAYLYNNSGIHGSIVKGKADYIFGKGWKIKKDWGGDEAKLKALMDSINGFQTLNELSRKIIFERTLYGGSYYLVEWGTFGKPMSISQLPYNTVRTDLECNTFFYSKEWTREMSAKSYYKRGFNKMPDDTIEYPAFDKNKKQGKQVLFLKDDNPSSDIYPLPEYEQGKTRIETDIECGFFHLNNVKTGFAAGTLVTLFNGNLDNDEGQDEVERAFKDKTTGTDNAGEILINFQNPGTTAPEISPLRSNELDKQFEQLSKDTINQILYAHRVTNGLLFGVKTPGELGGGRSEFDLAWEHFCNTYVKPKQEQQEEDINYLLSLYGFVGEPLELMVLDPIGIELTSETILKVLDQDSLSTMVYDKLGIEKPIDETKAEDVLSILNSASPLVANKILDSLTIDELRKIAKLDLTPGGNIIQPPSQPQYSKAFMKFQQDSVIAKFATIGESADNFELVFEVGKRDDSDSFAEQTTDEKIIEILKTNKKISVKDLAKKVGVSETQILKSLDKLNAKNIIAVKYVDGGKGIEISVENIEPEGIELYSKWQYSGPKDDKNRDFCREMLVQNKLYTRAEIDSLNNDMEDFNTDVWKYKGGWYTVPNTDGLLHVPACRHYWNSIIVRRKK